MARLTQIGFELNSTTAGVEFDSITGAPTIQTSTVRSGTYAMQCNPSATTAFLSHQYAAAGNTNNTYIRAYIRFASFPTANNISIFLIRSAAAGNNLIIHADSNGALSVTNEQAASVQVGNKSSGLRLNTWYRIELAYTYATGAVRAYIGLDDGPPQLFAQGTANASIDTNTFRIGLIDSATANMFIDDIAINDNTGTSQTDIPGPGKIVHLKPNATGDINGFTVQVGGTAGSANNFTRVQENSPDDATTYNGAALLNAEDLFHCDNFTGGAFSSINVVAVGVRMADLVAGDATTGVKVELLKITGGTKSQSAQLVPNSTSFQTNAPAAPRNYPLVTYANPDGGEWTQAFLDSMEVGYINSAVGVQTIVISTVWVSVDFTPVLYGTSTSTSSTSISSTSSSTSSTSVSTSSTSISSTSQSSSTSSTSTSISSTSSSTSSTSSSTSSTSQSSTSSSTSISSTSSSVSSTSQSSTSQSSTSSSSSISSTSSSISSTSSSVSSTSHSTSSTSVSSTSSSSSTSTTAIELKRSYRYEDDNLLDSDNTNIDNPFTAPQVSYVSGDDGDYFIEYGSEYVMRQYKYKHINNTDGCRFTWRGRSTYDTRVSPILIQIYNQGSTIASYSETNQDATSPTGNAITQVGQSITGNGGVVKFAKFYLSKTGTPSSNTMNLTIQAHTGVFGTSSAPTGANLAVSDNIDITSLTNSLALVTFTFSGVNQITLTNGTNYVLSISYGSGTGNLNVAYDGSSPTASGNYWDDNVGAQSGRDVCFYLYTSIPAWETLARETRVPADVDFTAQVVQSTNMSNYYDSNNIITFRSYQQVI